MRVVGYGRCSTAERARNGVSIEVQRSTVEHLAESTNWKLTWLADEGVSGGVPPESRKKFRAALALLEAGEVGALIFTKVDRASRCTEDYARLIRLSEEQDWQLIVTEMGIDTRTPTGKAMAHMAVVFAELERDFIRSRTREALAVGGTTVSSSADRGGRQTTWWPALYESAGEQDRVRHCPRPEQGRCADCAGASAWSQATVRALLMRESVH